MEDSLSAQVTDSYTRNTALGDVSKQEYVLKSLHGEQCSLLQQCVCFFSRKSFLQITSVWKQCFSRCQVLRNRSSVHTQLWGWNLSSVALPAASFTVRTYFAFDSGGESLYGYSFMESVRLCIDSLHLLLWSFILAVHTTAQCITQAVPSHSLHHCSLAAIVSGFQEVLIYLLFFSCQLVFAQTLYILCDN